ncbi:MAG: copper ion binding protein, partial [Pseudomonas sp.]|nr:copper ion binding protein [Pseudomonas sp.]
MSIAETLTTPDTTVALNDWRFPVQGMTCASCVARVEQALRGIAGVLEVNVNFATEQAAVKARGDVAMGTLKAAVEKAGYAVTEQPLRLGIEGMTCASCVSRVEKALRQLPGVLSAEVNLATETAEVKLVGGTISVPQLIAAVAKAGYQAHEMRAAGDSLADQARVAGKAGAPWWPVALAAVLSAPLILPMLGALAGRHWMLDGWLQW